MRRTFALAGAVAVVMPFWPNSASTPLGAEDVPYEYDMLAGSSSLAKANLNPNSWAGSDIWVFVYDAAAGAQYHVRSSFSYSLGGGNPEDVEAMLAIVRALFSE